MNYEHIVSFSGGKDSTALYLLALERDRPFRAVFADTGNEHEAVYEAVAGLAGITGGPEIETVRASFDRRIENKRNVVQTKWVKDGVPDEVIRAALELLHPTGNPFLDLCIWKGRFPSSRVRFCTEELKVQPIIDFIYQPAFAAGRSIISWQGVRAEESLARSLLPKWQRLEAKGGRVYAYRPLLQWKLQDVWDMHDSHGVKRNPLYDMGMTRVGCMPCIMAKKSEMLEISKRFPEHVERIANWERIVSITGKRNCATFFAAVDDPNYVDGEEVTLANRGIHQRVEWAKTSRGGKQYDMLSDWNTSCNQWGACE